MNTKRGGISWIDVIVTMSIMSIYGGALCPDVNESHYMTKAKNFWDSSFCSGDLFLESADAHWFFFVVFGIATKFFSLTVATWIGRLLCWFILACGWCRLASSISSLRLIGSASSLLFLFSLHYGQLSGEWVVGGCESKSVAYGFAFLALAAAVRSDWSWCMIHFGIACAFHIVTGGWIALAMVGALVFRWCVDTFIAKNGSSSSNLESCDVPRRSAAYLATSVFVALLFLAIGLVPALSLNADVDTKIAEEGAMVYVYARLPHHLRVEGFSIQRAASHMLLAVVTIIVGLAARGICARGVVETNYPYGSKSQPDVSLVLWTCAFGVVFAIAGAIIDFGLSSWAANWAANLLRYYWFRWNDVAWPVALCCFALIGIQRLSLMSYRQSWRLAMQLIFWGLLLVPGGVLCARRFIELSTTNIPPADYQSLIFANTTQAQAEATYRDWLDVCYWVRVSTSEESLWLTPRNQQTFKWNAHRPEVVCWKDSPQNAKDLVEWYRRVQLIFGADETGAPKRLNLVRAIDLSREFGFQYILTDKRSDPTPLTLPILYENDTFAVFEMLQL